mgnify:CR=1 FL=1
MSSLKQHMKMFLQYNSRVWAELTIFKLHIELTNISLQPQIYKFTRQFRDALGCLHTRMLLHMIPHLICQLQMINFCVYHKVEKSESAVLERGTYEFNTQDKII